MSNTSSTYPITLKHSFKLLFKIVHYCTSILALLYLFWLISASFL
nr:MAG TPA: hypothetical protein [Inoviridae sp.]